MSLFNKLFLPKDERKNSQKDIPTKIKLNLSGYKAEFSDGKWVANSKISTDDTESTIADLRETIQILREENNMLQLRNAILLQMLVDETATAIN